MKCLGKITVYFLIISLILLISKSFGENYEYSRFLISGITKTILLAFTFYLIWINNIKINKRSSLKKSVIYSLVSLSLIFFIVKYYNNEILKTKGEITQSEHLYFFYQCISTGFFEELFFRVLIFEIIVKYYQNLPSKTHFREAVITSGIFAIVHLANLNNTSYDFEGVIVQILFAFLFGLLAQSILYKTNSIILIGTLHGLINYVGMIRSKLFETSVESGDDGILQSLIAFFIIGIFVVLPIFYYSFRKRRT